MKCQLRVARTISALAALTVGLSGCVPLMAADLFVQGVDALTTDLTPRPGTSARLSRDGATAMSYAPVNRLAKDFPDCQFTGFIVPLKQGWMDAGGTAMDPDAIAAYGSVITKVTCPGKADTPVLRAGIQPKLAIHGGVNKGYDVVVGVGWDNQLDGEQLSEAKAKKYSYMFQLSYGVSSHDMLHPDSDGVPKWFSHAISRLAELSKTDPAIKDALRDDQTLIDTVLPDQTAAIDSVVQ